MSDLLQSLREWLGMAENLAYVSDEERALARKVLAEAGLSLERVERGGIIYTLRKVIRLLEPIAEE